MLRPPLWDSTCISSFTRCYYGDPESSPPGPPYATGLRPANLESLVLTYIDSRNASIGIAIYIGPSSFECHEYRHFACRLVIHRPALEQAWLSVQLQVRRVKQAYDDPTTRMRLHSAHYEMDFPIVDHPALILVHKLALPVAAVFVTPPSVRLSHFPVDARQLVWCRGAHTTMRFGAEESGHELKWNLFELSFGRIIKKRSLA